MYNFIMFYNQDLTSYCMEWTIDKLHLQTFPLLIVLPTNMQYTNIFNFYSNDIQTFIHN